ncbi:MAG: Stp1/IreP family PP2C-type Ser/Thr phosphatase [Chloroflexi bacterium]|nr:Stp1/IreP family PP2C-type Ser/Thr phosphatase [Chloroflexota bacterium]
MVEQGYIYAHLSTDTGRVREHNEDYIAFREPTDPQDEEENGWVYLVADGVGGADAGEVASKFASQRLISRYLESKEQPDWGFRLLDAMQAANADLRQLVAERNDNSRMATTMVTAVIQDNLAFIGNVGDSRAYQWRQGLFNQISKDHSLVAKLVEEGAITEEEASVHPRRNVILYSLGSERQPKIDIFERTLLPGDMLLLCSDGLTRHVTDEEISQIIALTSPETAANQLIQLANERGGEDNISVVVIQFQPDRLATVPPIAPHSTDNLAPTADIASPTAAALNRPLLWLYTSFLAIMMIASIFFIWLWLRV